MGSGENPDEYDSEGIDDVESDAEELDSDKDTHEGYEVTIDEAEALREDAHQAQDNDFYGSRGWVRGGETSARCSRFQRKDHEGCLAWLSGCRYVVCIHTVTGAPGFERGRHGRNGVRDSL